MHGFPADLNLDGITDSELYLGLGKYSIHFNFDDAGIVIYVEGRATVKENGKIIAEWQQDSNWSSLAFQKIVDAIALRYTVVSEQLLEIEFQNGLTLEIHDDDKAYEAAQIYFEDKSRKPVII